MQTGFLAAPRVREAIENSLGREYYSQFRPWLQAIANDKTIDPRGLAWWDRLAHTARINATMVGLGFRLSTIAVHGISAALNSVGGGRGDAFSQGSGQLHARPEGDAGFRVREIR